jgi:spermidine synthase
MYQGDVFPKEFESEEFIKVTQKLVAPEGIVIFNRLYYGEKRPQAARFGRVLEKMFKRVDVVYPEANVMFICEN